MRQAIAILVSLLFIVLAAPAQTRHDWSNVENLTRGTLIIVQLRAGDRTHGYFLNASEDGLRLAARVPFQLDAAYLREINRADVRKILLDRKEQNLPNPRTWTIGGAIIGGAAGVGLGIHRDSTEPTACGHACWLIDGVAGAGGGYMVALFSCAIVGISHLFRHNKLIYEDTAAHVPHIR